MNVCGGESHWRADEEGEVENESRTDDWPVRESVTHSPLTASGGETAKATEAPVAGSVAAETATDRASRVSGPAWGAARERRTEPRTAAEGKSKNRARSAWTERGWEESTKEWGSIGAIAGGAIGGFRRRR